MATPLGTALLERMAALGMRRQVELARAADISESTVGRLLYDDIEPERETLAKAGRALGLDVEYLWKLAQGKADPAAPPVAVTLHPRAAELDRMLAADSALTDAQRATLDGLVDAAMEGFRKLMRRRRIS